MPSVQIFFEEKQKNLTYYIWPASSERVYSDMQNAQIQITMYMRKVSSEPMFYMSIDIVLTPLNPTFI